MLPALLAIDCAHDLAAASLFTRRVNTPGWCRSHIDSQKLSIPDSVT